MPDSNMRISSIISICLAIIKKEPIIGSYDFNIGEDILIN